MKTTEQFVLLNLCKTVQELQETVATLVEQAERKKEKKIHKTKKTKSEKTNFFYFSEKQISGLVFYLIRNIDEDSVLNGIITKDYQIKEEHLSRIYSMCSIVNHTNVDDLSNAIYDYFIAGFHLDDSCEPYLNE